MPKMRLNDDAQAFSARLLALLEAKEQPRRGAGAYLARKYHVSNVVANAWLNGEYKPGLKVAEKIARDHGSTLDELYFDRKPPSPDPWPFAFDRARYDSLTPGQKIRAEAAILGCIVDMEGERTEAPQKRRVI